MRSTNKDGTASQSRPEGLASAAQSGAHQSELDQALAEFSDGGVASNSLAAVSASFNTDYRKDEEYTAFMTEDSPEQGDEMAPTGQLKLPLLEGSPVPP